MALTNCKACQRAWQAQNGTERCPFCRVTELLTAITGHKSMAEEHAHAVPDDIRADGWVVAVHNDYKLAGVPHTFWLFTKDDHCVKGEGLSDAEALEAVRIAIFRFEKEHHHAA